MLRRSEYKIGEFLVDGQGRVLSMTAMLMVTVMGVS